MLQQLKIYKPNEHFNVHYISCLHFGHDRDFIWGRRGFKSVQEHDETICQRWNERVTLNDTVISVGDNIFGEKADTRLLEYFRRLNFKRLYISPGNHFAGWRQLYSRVMNERYGIFGKDSPEVYPLEWMPFKGVDKTIFFMPNLYEGFVGNQPIVFSHYPIASWNGQSKGSWHICGHAHANYIPTTKEQTVGKMLDVCVESFGGPISHGEVEIIMSGRTITSVDHHSADTSMPFGGK